MFVCYRREAAAYPAALVYDRLCHEFGESMIFKDVDSIRAGENFVKRMTAEVSRSEILLAVIDPEWTSVVNSDRRPRLDNPRDFVRIEIETALARSLVVIPILVDDARMPLVEELPESLAPLVEIQAYDLGSTHASRDVDGLVTRIREILGELAAREDLIATRIEEHTPAPPVSPAPSPRPTSPTSPVAHPGPIWSVSPAMHEVVWSNPDPEPPSEARSTGGRRRMSRRGRFIVILAAVLLTLIGGSVAVLVPWNDSVTLPRSAKPLPDGTMVWRYEVRPKLTEIGLLEVSGKLGKTIVTGPGNIGPTLSPDRRTVFYVHRDTTASALHAISADGANDVLLFTASETCPTVRRPAWGNARDHRHGLRARRDGILIPECDESRRTLDPGARYGSDR